VAYVVGNPATDGFHRVFPGEAQAGPDALPPLPGAEQEATLVAETLRRGGYEVEEAIGPETALDVINRLYRRPYRIVHIAAHAFGKITLFFAAGAIYTAAHKTEVSQLDGIGLIDQHQRRLCTAKALHVGRNRGSDLIGKRCLRIIVIPHQKRRTAVLQILILHGVPQLSGRRRRSPSLPAGSTT
jgi:hypothetical protein